MKKILLFTLILVASACATNKLQQVSLSGFEGIWEGSGVQPDRNMSWTIKLTIIGNQYSIDYPSLGCGGKLSLLSSSLDKMEFNERITYGKPKCVDNGKTVIVKAGNNSTQYLWYYPSGKKGATGTLTRK